MACLLWQVQRAVPSGAAVLCAEDLHAFCLEVYYSLPTASYLLPTTYCLLLATYYLLQRWARTDCTKDVPLLLLSLSAAKRMCCTCEVRVRVRRGCVAPARLGLGSEEGVPHLRRQRMRRPGVEREGPRREGSAVVVRGDGWVGRVRVAGAVPS